MNDAATPISPRIALRLPSDPACLTHMRAVLRCVFAMTALDERTQRLLITATEEAWTNIIRHAYSGDTTRPVELEAEVHHDRVTLVLSDEGACCDKKTFEPRERAPLEPGRMGLRLLHDTFDQVEFERTPAGCNRLCLMKQLPPTIRLRLPSEMPALP